MKFCKRECIFSTIILYIENKGKISIPLMMGKKLTPQNLKTVIQILGN